MRKISFVLSCLLLAAACSKKEDSPPAIMIMTTLGALPAELAESSGLERSADGLLWSHNDGGPARIYAFNEQGQLSRTLTLENAVNEDWEDMAIDAQGNFFIGDFGNNNNDRQDLKIYKITAPLSPQATSVEPEVIQFSLEDQAEFPPPAAARFFDIEALFARGDALYLLTRDRSDPFLGKTTLYRLPATPGTFTATVAGTFLTENITDKGAITSADLSPDGSRLAILSNEVVWVFSQFSGTDFFSGRVERYDLLLDRQMEGIVFQDNCSLFLTNETQPGLPGMLFQLKICE